MPAEDFKGNTRVKARSLQAVDKGLLVRFGIVNEVVDLKGISRHLHH